jgi:hypothetical protein
MGKTGPAATLPSYLDAYTALSMTVCPACDFTFLTSSGGSGIFSATSDVRLAPDDATFTVANAGTYLVSIAVGPVGPVQLEVNGTRVGPNEASCGTAGTSVCAFQRILNLQALSTIRLVNTSGNDEHEGAGSGITILRIA